MDAPVPFIIGGSHKNDPLRITEEGHSILSSSDEPVVIITIVGKYRTGKSFLMNKIYGKNSGFPLGGSIQSKTKGIWMWHRRHNEKPGHRLLLLDTEGLYDVEKGDDTYDMKLFTLAILLSSVVVFNVTGILDSVMIQHLEYPLIIKI
jgi:predicted GTPase